VEYRRLHNHTASVAPGFEMRSKSGGATLNVEARYVAGKYLVRVLVPEGEASRTGRVRAVVAGLGAKVYVGGVNELQRGLRYTSEGGVLDTRLRYERDQSGASSHPPFLACIHSRKSTSRLRQPLEHAAMNFVSSKTLFLPDLRRTA
jgi:hypothetical protein